jgi:hypothetical protein
MPCRVTTGLFVSAGNCPVETGAEARNRLKPLIPGLKAGASTGYSYKGRREGSGSTRPSSTG